MTEHATEITSQTVYPCICYRDAQAGIGFLESTFGFERHAVHEEDGVVQHAELRLGDDFVMAGSETDIEDNPELLDQRAGHRSVYMAVSDPDGLYERAKGAGAEIVRELRDTDYGDHGFTARDPEGNLWSFGIYRPQGSE